MFTEFLKLVELEVAFAEYFWELNAPGRGLAVDERIARRTFARRQAGEQAQERMLHMYGVRDIEEWRATVLEQNAIFEHSVPFLVVSMLSDVQEQIAMGSAEDARRHLNRVKHLIIHELMPAGERS